MELGSDIHSDWELINGDLKLVHEENNLAQAVENRLNCIYESLNLFYLDYGSNLHGILGWRNVEGTEDFIRLEIINTLKQDPRFKNFDVKVTYNGDGEITVELSVKIDDEELKYNLVIDEYGDVAVGSE